ncbi:DoxX family membrane protein [Kitasatospora sp. MBT63]|uniref:DoxX family membrane protein n=1 Tax=Kitasatospora sp. MBT63 TaxID=1444768 RepID=UPI001E508EC6|nr:DoxX family membrane protein [Kitasatospora sp. MBT63]
MFLYGGADAVLNPARLESTAEPVVDSLADHLPVVPQRTRTAIRLNAAAQLAAGALLATGRLTRPAALALAATLVPVTLAGHRFWEIKDDEERAQQRIHFLKNLSMCGGLLLAVADSGAGPSLGWRARHRQWSS